MAKIRLAVRLFGGLGNQMFQYAAARAVSLRNGMELALDTKSGFIKDNVFGRTFSLDVFPIIIERVSFGDMLPLWFQQAWHKYMSNHCTPVKRLPWGIFLYEGAPRFYDEVAFAELDRNTWMHGYWQNEKYFSGYNDLISREFTIPEPVESNFISMTRTIESCASVAVCVRRYEEVPTNCQSGSVRLEPFTFYKDAAFRLMDKVNNPIFFVFSTASEAVRKLCFPGPTYYLTPDKGFNDPIQTLWLISRCKHHVISNSSFYWWGAWLAERQNPNRIILTCDTFAHSHTIPKRWTRLSVPNRA